MKKHKLSLWSKLKYRLDWMSILNSPFKRPSVKFYFGKIKIGTPYFLPRRLKCDKFVPMKFGIDIVSHGWKTKWTNDDYRHEWQPMIHFVGFNRQFVIFIGWFNKEKWNIVDDYWEAFLYWKHSTKGTKKERIKQLLENFNLTHTISHYGCVPSKVNNYYKVLKSKYYKFIDIYPYVPKEECLY